MTCWNCRVSCFWKSHQEVFDWGSTFCILICPRFLFYVFGIGSSFETWDFFLWLSRGNLLLFIFQFSFLLCGECIRILMFHFAQFLLKFRLSINIVSDLIAMITRCGHFAQEFADGYSTISSEDWTLLGVVCLLFSHLYFWPTSFGERQQHGD